MERDDYTRKLIESHVKMMEKINRDTPPLIITAKLIKQEKNKFGVQGVFQVIKTSQKVKLNSLIEEKLFLDDEFKLKGTVVDIYDSYVVLQMSRTINDGIYELKRHANYNNEILLQKAKLFIESNKNIHECLFNTKGSGFSHISETDPEMKQTGELKDQKDSQAIGPEIGNEKTELQSENIEANQLHSENVYFHLDGKENQIDKMIENLNVADSTNSVFFFNQNLNKIQRYAVEFAMKKIPFKILGPPGTGKTETIVEMICQFLKSKNTVLVCGPSNISIDNIIQKFMKSLFYKSNKTSFYRLGSSSKGMVSLNLENMADEALSFMNKEIKMAQKKDSSKNKMDKNSLNNQIKDRIAKRKEFISTIKKDSPLVFATLFSSLKEAFYFDVCIVDEACQATELECFMGIVKAKNFILAGDPNQLCPDQKTLYQKTIIPTIILNEQYRMHNELIAFSNKFFYNNLIISNKEDDHSFFGHRKIVFVDTSYFDYNEEDFEKSKINSKEADLIIECAKWLHKTYRNESVGIIVPYSAQSNLINEQMDSIPNCTVNTVDGFQGQERDFIILGLVRSNDSKEFGFLSDKKRFNVAVTRCKKGLIIIGDSENFRESKFFKQYFEHINKVSTVIDPDTFKLVLGGAKF